MPQDFQEEEVIGKAYDSRLMWRLLGYARPYWRRLLTALFMLAVITTVGLAQPYLLKLAIDDHILALTQPMRAFPVEAAPRPGVRLGGQILLRESELPLPVPESVPRYQILQFKKVYYLVSGAALNPETDKYTVARTGGDYEMHAGGRRYPARPLDRRMLLALRAKDQRGLLMLGLLFLGLAAAGFVFSYLQAVLLQSTAQRIIHFLRLELFTHLMHMSLSFYDRNPVGRLVTRVTNDTDTLNEMYSSVLVNLFRNVFMILGTAAIMLRLNLRLALVCFAVLPLIAVAAVIFRRYAREAYRRVRTALARINAFLSENIMGMRIVQIFVQEGKKHKEFKEINQRYFDASMRELTVFAVFRPIMDFLFMFTTALLIWYGGRQVLGGVISFGVLVAFTGYIGQFFQPIMELTEQYNILQAAMASSERIFLLLDTEPDRPEPVPSPPAGRFAGHVEFRNVWFAYHGEEWVLRDVSFVIEPGRMAAFVGATGAGKTSIISLLTRLYEIQRGQILIDGVDIRSYATDELRRNIGTVLQDVFLFTGDIASNIRLNNTAIDDGRIEEVARYVNADRFIRALPGGYREPVMERGATLSAGQRQLLAFARTLAFDPSVLVLDEATANIDTETEALIQQALHRLIQGRTAIVVAHRLSTIQHADKIIVLHKGRIREAGNHQELLGKRGLYYDLYRLQYGDIAGAGGGSET